MSDDTKDREPEIPAPTSPSDNDPEPRTDAAAAPEKKTEESSVSREAEAPTEPAAEPTAEPTEIPTAEGSPEVLHEKPAEAVAADEPGPVADGVEAKAAGDDKPEPAKAPDEEPGKPRRSRADQARVSSLYRAYRARRSLEGRIEGVIKGGYEIRLGKIRGFCPHSQIDVLRVEDPEQLIGKTMNFRITQVRRGGEDVVVSRRQVIEDERADEAKAVRATLVEGSVMQGKVAGLAKFGAFVDLGAGVMGLVHVSELSHNRIDRVEEAASPGNTVQVKVLKIDDQKGRIALSMRQAVEDPWAAVAQRFEIGKVYRGTVRRLADFGAFVELASGVEALAPASEFPPSRQGWREGLEPDGEREWMVLSVDPRQRRISVVPAVEGQDLSSLPALEEGATMTGRVQRVESFGVFVWLGPGRVGLLPAVWSGTPKGSDLTRRFPISDEVEVEIVEVADDGRRIRLARPGQRTAEPERRGRRESRPSRSESRSGRSASRPADASHKDDGAFGTLLADKLRDLLKP